MSAPTWEDAETLAFAAGWDKVTATMRGDWKYVRLWRGDACWEALVARGSTPAECVLFMLERDARTGGDLGRSMAHGDARSFSYLFGLADPRKVYGPGINELLKDS